MPQGSVSLVVLVMVDGVSVFVSFSVG